jgi:Ca2+/Na+ antiporter
MADSAGLSKTFVGIILVPIIGNAAEHSSAILMALRNKMNAAVEIALGSSLQIILFVVPVLILLSLLFTLLTSAALFVTYLTGWGADAIVALLGISGVSFASIVCRVMELICCYKTFCDFEPEYSVLYLILSILGLEWIALFLCRRNVPVGIAGHCHPRQPRYNEE